MMHSKSDNIEISINDRADEVIKEIYDSLKSRYQNNLESMKGSKFAFDRDHLLYYNKINPNHGGLYVDSVAWIRIKKQQQIPSIKKITNIFTTL